MAHERRMNCNDELRQQTENQYESMAAHTLIIGPQQRQVKRARLDSRNKVVHVSSVGEETSRTACHARFGENWPRAGCEKIIRQSMSKRDGFVWRTGDLPSNDLRPIERCDESVDTHRRHVYRRVRTDRNLTAAFQRAQH